MVIFLLCIFRASVHDDVKIISITKMIYITDFNDTFFNVMIVTQYLTVSYSLDSGAATKALENLNSKVFPEFGASSALQIRYADLEINESDLTRNVTNKISNKVTNNNENIIDDSKNRENSNDNNSNNFDIIFKNLNMNTNDMNGTEKMCDDMKFNSYYVNPEPICSSTTDHIIVPGCEIIEG